LVVSGDSTAFMLLTLTIYLFMALNSLCFADVPLRSYSQLENSYYATPI